MNFLSLAGMLALALCWPQEPAAQDPAPQSPFRVVDVVVDSGTSALGAWQCQIAIEGNGARVVSVEGGEAPAFRRAPYHDPAAFQKGRLVIAAFSTDDALPKGSVLVARLHLHVDAGAQYRLAVAVQAAAGPDGTSIPATAQLL